MNQLKILFLILLISGCAKRKIENKFYLIEPLPVNTNVSSPYLFEEGCQIFPAEIYPAFSTSRIAHRNESHQIIYYNHHQWAVMPEVLLTQIIEHNLQHHKLFKQVDSRIRIDPGYSLITEVLQLETVAQKNDLLAHLNISFRLLNAKTQNVVIEYSADRYEPLQKNDLNLFAQAINSILHQELNNLAERIKSDLQKS